jgi:hypothetical protein
MRGAHRTEQLANNNIMRKTVIAALLVSASVASAATATMKVGALSFALNNDYQADVKFNNVNTLDTLSGLMECAGTAKYTAKTQTINNKSILNAIGKALGLTFTSKAKLVIINYDNSLTAPPYPPYLIVGEMASVVNGPRTGTPSLSQTRDLVGSKVFTPVPTIDWVTYDRVDLVGTDLVENVWPKASVYVYDPGLTLSCVNVTGFFSFEEAYCYFCWDTVDRVTQGSFTTGTSTSGDFCLGIETTCGLKGSGTTKFYLTIKFNNSKGLNPWIDPLEAVYDDATYTWLSALYAQQVSDVNKLIFTVAGVVRYPWSIKAVNGLTSNWGTMTMSGASGYTANPYCGVCTGSVTISQTTDLSIPLPCVVAVNQGE